MTFLVNHQGIVFQKDLGPTTARIAGEMKSFNPDGTWQRVPPTGGDAQTAPSGNR